MTSGGGEGVYRHDVFFFSKYTLKNTVIKISTTIMTANINQI